MKGVYRLATQVDGAGHFAHAEVDVTKAEQSSAKIVASGPNLLRGWHQSILDGAADAARFIEESEIGPVAISVTAFTGTLADTTKDDARTVVCLAVLNAVLDSNQLPLPTWASTGRWELTWPSGEPNKKVP